MAPVKTAKVVLAVLAGKNVPALDSESRKVDLHHERGWDNYNNNWGYNNNWDNYNNNRGYNNNWDNYNSNWDYDNKVYGDYNPYRSQKRGQNIYDAGTYYGRQGQGSDWNYKNGNKNGNKDKKDTTDDRAEEEDRPDDTWGVPTSKCRAWEEWGKSWSNKCPRYPENNVPCVKKDRDGSYWVSVTVDCGPFDREDCAATARHAMMLRLRKVKGPRGGLLSMMTLGKYFSQPDLRGYNVLPKATFSFASAKMWRERPDGWDWEPTRVDDTARSSVARPSVAASFAEQSNCVLRCGCGKWVLFSMHFLSIFSVI